MKISASIFSSQKGENLKEVINDLDQHNIDLFHIDCDDDVAVFDKIGEIRNISSTPVDLHLITSSPEKYFGLIQKHKVEYASFQYENLKDVPQLPKDTGTNFGLSITSDTPIDVFEQFKDSCSFVMLMSTVPGKSGGSFNSDSFQKIIAFRNRFPGVRIHVDGGVNDEIGYILRLLGVNAIVSGSYLMNHESLGAGMLSFHQSPVDHHAFMAREFMTPVKYLPVLQKDQLNFKTVLRTIENYKQGFVLVIDKADQLVGVITNADVRRGLIQNIGDLNAVNPESLMNPKPVFIREGTTVATMVGLLNELNFIVLFLPVVDENKKLKGAVMLNNLIRV